GTGQDAKPAGGRYAAVRGRPPQVDRPAAAAVAGMGEEQRRARRTGQGPAVAVHRGREGARRQARARLGALSRAVVGAAQVERLASSAHTPAADSSEPPARWKRRCARGEASSRRAEAANTAY